MVIIASQQIVRQPQRQRRKQEKDRHHDRLCEQKPTHAAEDDRQAYFRWRHRFGREHVQSNRRGDEPDLDELDDDNAHPDQVEAEPLEGRQQDRDGQQHHAERIKHHAEQQKQHGGRQA